MATTDSAVRRAAVFLSRETERCPPTTPPAREVCANPDSCRRQSPRMTATRRSHACGGVELRNGVGTTSRAGSGLQGDTGLSRG